MSKRQEGEYRPAGRGVAGVAAAFFLIGTAVGAAVALLVAPHSGRITRRLLRRRAEDAADLVAERAEELRERGEEILESAKEKVSKFPLKR
ncbi:MAG TPA: YtxH domain-containing protein [Terriglobales bacterium]|nr:YtxH domain-containing protein [Terriglobales bacterium]